MTINNNQLRQGRTWVRSVAPTVDDDETLGYVVGDEWVDDVTQLSYRVFDVTTGAAEWIEQGGSGGAGHTLKYEGTPVTNRAGLNFVGDGVGVADDSGNDETDVTIPSTAEETIAAASEALFDFNDKIPWVKADGSFKHKTWVNILSKLDETFATISGLLSHVTSDPSDHPASTIPITDAGGYFTGDDVEAALQELGAGGNASGWTTVTETWTRTGNHSFTVPGDLTARYRKGAKVKYNDGAVDYGVVGSSSHAAGTTTVNLIPNTSYVMAATTITDKFVSYIENPEGFPGAFSYTPTYSSTGGGTPASITTHHAFWEPIGKRQIKLDIAFTINTFAPATGTIVFSIPVAVSWTTVGVGRENNVLGALLQPVAGSGASTAFVFTYNNGAIATNGYLCLISMVLPY